MPAVRAVAFDFNGTLSDDESLLCEIYRELFAEQGKPLAAKTYYDVLAGNTEEAIIGGWLGVEGDRLAALVAERIDRYRLRAAGGATVDETVRAAVRYASRRVPVAVVSGAFRAEIEPVLEGAGLAGSFSMLVTADDVVRGKPDPECYQLLVRRLGDGIESSHVLVFEDTEAGVTAAADAGCCCVAVLGTMPAERLTRAEECVEEIDVPLLERLLA